MFPTNAGMDMYFDVYLWVLHHLCGIEFGQHRPGLFSKLHSRLAELSNLKNWQINKWKKFVLNENILKVRPGNHAWLLTTTVKYYYIMILYIKNT